MMSGWTLAANVVTSHKDSNSDLASQLSGLGVEAAKLAAIKYVVDRPPEWGSLLSTISFILPGLLVVGLIYFMFRQAQGTNNQAMSFGKSRARMFTGEHPTVTFEDVAGAEEAKQDLQEVVEFLKEPEKFVSLGARIPKGVLLVGSPGTGKTLLAKAVSGEAGVPFFSISGSEFVEMFVGVGASRVRDLFDQAKRHSPCIVFVDEIDAVGRHRGAGLGGSHDEREQTLNQILVEMDGFDTDTNVIVVAATNRPDILDPALLRPGRFDRRVVLDRPDMKGREEIFKVHVRGKPLSDDVNLNVLAKSTPGFVGADIENMVNEAAIVAARRNKKIIAMTDFEEAMERVMLGPERKSRVIQPKEKKITAYHEAGHAVVMRALPNSDPLRKVTIIPRGFAAGLTWSMPEDDNSHMTRAKLTDMLAGILGGPRGRRDRVQRHHHRRQQRSGEGDRDRAQHGAALGHEREARPAGVWQEGRTGLPGQGTGRAARLQRSGGAADRRRSAAPGERSARDGAAHPQRKPRAARSGCRNLDRDRIAGSGRVREGVERRRAAEAGQFRRHAGRAAPKPSKPAPEAPTPAGNKPNPAPQPA